MWRIIGIGKTILGNTNIVIRTYSFAGTSSNPGKTRRDNPASYIPLQRTARPGGQRAVLVEEPLIIGLDEQPRGKGRSAPAAGNGKCSACPGP